MFLIIINQIPLLLYSFVKLLVPLLKKTNTCKILNVMLDIEATVTKSHSAAVEHPDK